MEYRQFLDARLLRSAALSLRSARFEILG